MRWVIFSLCLFVFVAAAFAKGHQEDELAQWFLRLKSLLKDCPPTPFSKSNTKNAFLQTLRYCMQNRALFAIDGIFSDDIIPIIDGIDLVRFKVNNNSEETKSNGSEKYRDNEDKSWSEVILNRIGKVFRTHVLKVDIDVLSKSLYPTDSSSVMEARKRNKRRYNIMPLMATGLLLMGSVLIPMGFQFLAVLGGKALLLAKMALVLSSIQGLKKIATNSMNYGFYHAPIPDQWHERSHPDPNIYVNPPPPYSTYHHL